MNSTFLMSCCLLTWSLYLIRSTETSLKQGAQFGLYQLFAQGRNSVDKHRSVEVVKLVLHNSGEVTLHPLIMLSKVLILILYPYALWTNNILAYCRQREASLL